MRIVVIEEPKPIITPKDLPGAHEDDDAFVTAMIAAAQGEIDGPNGWLGRALGEQVLELTSDHWPGSLPFRPIVGVESVTVDGAAIDGVQAEWDGVLVTPSHLPRGRVVIRYRAGYVTGKTGVLPAHARAAVILAARLLCSMGEGDVFLQQEQTNGVGTRTRTVTPYVAETLQKAIGNLLSPLRIYA